MKALKGWCRHRRKAHIRRCIRFAYTGNLTAYGITDFSVLKSSLIELSIGSLCKQVCLECKGHLHSYLFCYFIFSLCSLSRKVLT